MKIARQRCPEAIVIRGNSANYSKQSELITEIIKSEVPLFEKSSIDEFYADLSGMTFFWLLQICFRTQKKNHTREWSSDFFGLSVNKLVSKVATGEAKPNNQLKIDKGFEKPFLAPLPIHKIPMVGEKTNQKLRTLGIRKVADVQQMPLDVVQKVFERWVTSFGSVQMALTTVLLLFLMKTKIDI